MSRVGRRPIPLPKEVNVKVEDGVIFVKGPKGTLSRTLPPKLEVELSSGQILVKRKDDTRQSKAFHGLYRTLLSNMVEGVVKGFEKHLLIQGVGYRAAVQGQSLVLQLGFSHPVKFPIPEGVQIEVKENVKIRVWGIDKEFVGQVAAKIKKIKEADPYKGKGIRYADVPVKLKAGKIGAKQ